MIHVRSFDLQCSEAMSVHARLVKFNPSILHVQNCLTPVVCERRAYHTRSSRGVSRPICDPILKELEGPTKDRSAYWRRFCKVHIITSYHYIIVGDTYKGTQCHMNTTLHHT